MIRLFRKIRQQLLSKNNYSIYLLYAGGEFILVVVGILFALQIDNWNENKQLRNTEQQYLLALKEEFNFNKSELERVMSLNTRNADYALKLVDNMGPESPEITEEEFGILATASLSREVQFNPSQGVLDEIISSGKLGLFSNNELKFALSSWTGLLQTVKLQEQELQRIRYRTIDIVRNEANLRKVIYGPGLERLGIKQSKFKQGNLHLLKSLSFEGHMVGFVTMSLSLNRNDYQKFSDEIDRILMLIDDEIK
jgi:hypothetical protein